ncbi:DNA repair protein RadC [Desulfotomaculum arcticum]|uniref:DNA repair protein RadC n=1 Tax=Desulfotruncus arcticus DSM 17038 TaxID=1121424 RepID=A0A1I2Y4P0_9FIRM|nr:DNA repair protein RadC [Desulfotruncus arcticus]SFH20738.1 DNA repair protein RadC [Desulfotomaculum arcticum] [Desulfotruncus arcticus DSM 17038]
MQNMLWSEEELKQYTKEVPSSRDLKVKRPVGSVHRTLSLQVREEAIRYGVESSELFGVLGCILGPIPDETMEFLMKQGLRALAQMSSEELLNLPGIGIEKSIRLAAAFELARRMTKLMPEDLPFIKSPEDAAALVMEEMRYLDREHFWALLLNTKNQVIARETISIGTLNSSPIHPRELYKNAVRRSAAGLVLVHNHPSGDPTPSQQDIEVTKRLIEAGNIIGINVLDHLVIGDSKFVSFKAKGYI